MDATESVGREAVEIHGNYESREGANPLRINQFLHLVVKDKRKQNKNKSKK